MSHPGREEVQGRVIYIVSLQGAQGEATLAACLLSIRGAQGGATLLAFPPDQGGARGVVDLMAVGVNMIETATLLGHIQGAAVGVQITDLSQDLLLLGLILLCHDGFEIAFLIRILIVGAVILRTCDCSTGASVYLELVC